MGQHYPAMGCPTISFYLYRNQQVSTCYTMLKGVYIRMKILSFLLTTLPMISTLFLLTFLSSAAFSQNHTRLGLPVGAKARLGKGRIHQIKYFPDGKRLAVATSIGIWIYDIQTGETLSLLTGHTALVTSIAFSPDGGTLASGSKDNTINLWDTSTGKHKFTCIGHEKDVKLLAFSPTGKMLASTSEDWKIRLWNVQTGKSLQTITECGAEDMYAMVYSPDGMMFLTFRYDDRDAAYIEFWDAQNGEFLNAVLIKTNFDAAAISPDCKILAVVGKNSFPLRLWDIKTGKLLKSSKKFNESYEYIEFSPDGRNVVTGGLWDSVSIWDVSTAELLNSMARGEPINSVTYSPDGKVIASGSDDGTIRFWDVATGKLIKTITGHLDSQFFSAAFSPDDGTLICGGESKVQFWNPQTYELMKTIEERRCNVYTIKYSPDANIFATGGTSKKARLWDAKTGRFLGRFSAHKDQTPYRNKEKVSTVAFSPDGNMLATGGSDNQVCLWEIRIGELYLIGERLAAFTEHTENVSSVAFSPDGNVLASGSQDKTIQLWDINTRKHLKTLTGHEEGVTAVVHSPDGTTLASGSQDGTIRLWNVNTSDHIKTIEEAGHVTSLSYSPDGSVLASGTEDNNVVKIWNAQTGQCLQTFTGHTQRVNAMVFSPDGKTLASVSSDGTILLWDLTTSTLNQ